MIDEFKSQDMNPIIITNIDLKYLENLARMTETIVVPNTNLLDKNFILGTCQNFKQELLNIKEDDKKVFFKM